MIHQNNYQSRQNKIKVPSDFPFFTLLLILSCLYIFLLVGSTLVNFKYVDQASIIGFFEDPNIMHSLKLSLYSCTITTILCLIVAVPIGYLMSRFEFRGKALLDTILDIPIMLPPIVVGIGLLIFFNTDAVNQCEVFLQKLFDNKRLKINPTFTVAGVILAQFMVACAFAVRSMRTTFDEISVRQEQVALTLGCSRGQAFYRIVLPRARMGMVSAATLAWARSLGEFGPILIFAGTTRMKTEVLSTTVYLEFSVGNLAMASTVSIFMIITAVVIVLLMRLYGNNYSHRENKNHD